MAAQCRDIAVRNKMPPSEQRAVQPRGSEADFAPHKASAHKAFAEGGIRLYCTDGKPAALEWVATKAASSSTVEEAVSFIRRLRSELQNAQEKGPRLPDVADVSSFCCTSRSSPCSGCFWLQQPPPTAKAVAAVQVGGRCASRSRATVVASWLLQQLLKNLGRHKGPVQPQESLLLAALLATIPHSLSGADLGVVLDVVLRMLADLQQRRAERLQGPCGECASALCCMRCACCSLRQLLSLLPAAEQFKGALSLPSMEVACRIAAAVATTLLRAAQEAGGGGSSEVCCCSHRGAHGSNDCHFLLLKALCAAAFRMLSRLLAAVPVNAHRHVIAMLCSPGRQAQQPPCNTKSRSEQALKGQQQPAVQPEPDTHLSLVELLFSVLGLEGLIQRGLFVGIASPRRLLHERHASSRSGSKKPAGLALLQREIFAFLRDVALFEQRETRGSSTDSQEQLQLAVSVLQPQQKGATAAHRLLFDALAAIGRQQRQHFRALSQEVLGTPQEADAKARRLALPAHIAAVLPALGVLESLPEMARLLLDGITCSTASIDMQAPSPAAAAEEATALQHVAALDGFLLLLQSLEPLLELPLAVSRLSARKTQTREESSQNQQHLLCTESIRWGGVVQAWHLVCSSSVLSPRLLVQRRHQRSLAAFCRRCLRAVRELLQQLSASYVGELPGTAAGVAGAAAVLECIGPMRENRAACLVTTGRCHAAVGSGGKSDGSAEFLQLLVRTYARMNDTPALLEALGKHIEGGAMGCCGDGSSSGSEIAESVASSNLLVLQMKRTLKAFAGASQPRGSMCFALRDEFLDALACAASQALASQVPLLLQHMRHLLQHATRAVLQAFTREPPRGEGFATLMINAAALQLMMGAFLRGLQGQPSQQQEFLLPHLLAALPDAISPLVELRPLLQESALAESGHQERQLMQLLAEGCQSLRLSICLLLRHIRSFAAAPAAAAAKEPPDAAAARLVAGNILALADAIRHATEATQALQQQQAQQRAQERGPSSDDPAEDALTQHQILIGLHQQEQALQLQQTHALQRLEYLLLVDQLRTCCSGLPAEGAEAPVRKRQKQRKQEPLHGHSQQQDTKQPPNEDDVAGKGTDVAGCQAAVLLLLLLHEARVAEPRDRSTQRLLLLQLHRVCCCFRDVNATAAAASAAEGHWLQPHLPLLFSTLPRAESALEGSLEPCAACGESAKEVIECWPLSPELLEQQAAVSVLLRRWASLLRSAAAAALSDEVSSATKRQRTCGGSAAASAPPATAATATAAVAIPAGAEGRFRKVAGAAAVWALGTGLCQKLCSAVFASSSREDALDVAIALWEAFQAMTRLLQRQHELQDLAGRAGRSQHRLLLDAAVAAIKALGHVCCNGASSTAAGMWAAACISKARLLREALAPLGLIAAVNGSEGYGAEAAEAVAEALADLPTEDDEAAQEQQRKQVRRDVKGAVERRDAAVLLACCTGIAQSSVPSLIWALRSQGETLAVQQQLLVPLACLKALHALGFSWLKTLDLQKAEQPELGSPQEAQPEATLLQGLATSLPSGCHRALMVVVAAALSAAVDEQEAALCIMGSPAAVDAQFPWATHLAALALDLVGLHQSMGAWVLQRRAASAPEDSELEEEDEKVQQQLRRTELQTQRRVFDQISASVVLRSCMRTPRPLPVLQAAGRSAKHPQRLSRLLRRLQRLLLPDDDHAGESATVAAAATSNAHTRLRNSGMRLLQLLCAHWSGAMKHLAWSVRQQQVQGESQEEEAQQRQMLSEGEALCKAMTANLTELLLHATRRELQLFVASAVAGAAPLEACAARDWQGAAVGGAKKMAEPRGVASWAMDSEALQHLLSAVLHQEQQQAFFAPCAYLFPTHR
ncbi:hypothetical protein cyc_01032 [Cyclospora cayetanensis]|uniref:Uncharacterized protein n=1 Tax=Cyclospora cayetanensis TaxID=88456 RepID=A0A1D3DAR7_9EIME|nr:hypothetical protein cyc_01032 [Cyclospora cayetanensis]